jgi:protocatechuate 3,4-dioxygenase beta subunit
MIDGGRTPLRRRFLILTGLALVAVAVALALWLRPARRPPAGHGPTVAAVPPRPPSPRPAAAGARAAFAWLGQRGVAGHRIAGRVVHAGKPVANAAVRLTTQELRVGEWTLAEVKTDAAGRFDLGRRPAILYRVVAQADGLVAAGAEVDLRAVDPRPAPDAVTIELRDCDVVVGGTVRDAGGGVIIGAHIRAGTYASDFGITSSDGEGRYRLCASAGPMHVEASADGYGTVVEHAHGRRDVSVDFALAPELVIAGRVVDADGAPVDGAVVVAATNGHDPGVVADSGADGRFRLAGLVAGTYLVVARADDRAADKSVTVAAGGATADDLVLLLERRTPLTGRVLVGDRPAAGATVIVASADEGWKLGSAVTQADGRFEIAALPRRTVHVSVQGHKLVSPDADIDLAVVRDADLTCVRLAKVSGRVLRAGEPVGRADVRLYKEREYVERAIAHDDGTFELDGVEPGSYDIGAHSLGSGAAVARRPLEVGAEDVGGIVLELDRTASIAGVVVDTTGAPVAGVTVDVNAQDDHASDVTAADGTFVVAPLVGGADYRAAVRQTREPFRPYEPPAGQSLPAIHVADGTRHITGVRLTVVRGSLTISGVVVRAGEPVAGVTIRAWSEKGAAHAESGPDGAFVLGELVAGSYHIGAGSWNNLQRTSITAEAGAKDVRVELSPTGAVEGVLHGFGASARVMLFVQMDPRRFETEVTDAKFAIADVPAGTYDVRAVGANGARGSARATVTANAVARVTIDAEATARLAGVVTDWLTRAPIADAECNWAADGVRGLRPVKTDAAGGFALTVPVGRIAVWCQLPAQPSVLAHNAIVDLAPDASARVAVELVVGNRWGYDPSVHLEGRPPEPVRVIDIGRRTDLRVGDVVVAIDGRSVVGLGDDAVMFLLGQHTAADPARVTVERDGAELVVDFTPETAPRGR